MKKIFLFSGAIVAVVIIGGGVFVFSYWPRELTYQNRTMTQWLKILGTNPSSKHSVLKEKLDRLARFIEASPPPPENALSLFQVFPGTNRETVTFELPVSYDLLAKHDFFESNGKLCLLVDDVAVSCHDCNRAANGNCLLTWDAINSTAGLHQIQAKLLIGGHGGRRMLEARGPTTLFTLSHTPDICHVDWSISDPHFKGIILYARLTDSDAAYHIELQTTNGHLVRTITGNTTNGIINERWDLMDDHGNKYTNPTVNALYRVTLTNSFSQTKNQLYNIEYP